MVKHHSYKEKRSHPFPFTRCNGKSAKLPHDIGASFPPESESERDFPRSPSGPLRPIPLPAELLPLLPLPANPLPPAPAPTAPADCRPKGPDAATPFPLPPPLPLLNELVRPRLRCPWSLRWPDDARDGRVWWDAAPLLVLLLLLPLPAAAPRASSNSSKSSS